MGQESKARLNLILSFAIFGTIGIFVKYVDMPTPVISLTRGLIGACFIYFAAKAKKRDIDWKGIKDNLALLIIIGIVMGFNWILLFQSYDYTTVAIASVCYYLQPIFLIIASPFVLGEKLNLKKVICVIVALVGMIFVSGAIESKSGDSNPKGVLLAVGAGFLYAVVVLLNKKLKPIDSSDSTMVQLFSAGVVMIPYCAVTNAYSAVSLNPLAILLLAIICFCHTGIAYVLYFGAVHKLPAQTVAIYGYIDPILSIVLSALLLREPFGIYQFIGAVLILGSTFISDYQFKKKA